MGDTVQDESADPDENLERRESAEKIRRGRRPWEDVPKKKFRERRD